MAHWPTEIKHVAVFSEVSEHTYVFAIAAPTFDEADVAARRKLFDVVERRLAKLDQVYERENALVDVEQRHVAAETSRQRLRRECALACSRHGCLARPSTATSLSYLRSPIGTVKPTRFLSSAPTGHTSIAFRAVSSESASGSVASTDTSISLRDSRSRRSRDRPWL
jgi:hypothetical protein